MDKNKIKVTVFFRINQETEDNEILEGRSVTKYYEKELVFDKDIIKKHRWAFHFCKLNGKIYLNLAGELVRVCYDLERIDNISILFLKNNFDIEKRKENLIAVYCKREKKEIIIDSRTIYYDYFQLCHLSSITFRNTFSHSQLCLFDFDISADSIIELLEKSFFVEEVYKELLAHINVINEQNKEKALANYDNIYFAQEIERLKNENEKLKQIIEKMTNENDEIIDQIKEYLDEETIEKLEEEGVL